MVQMNQREKYTIKYIFYVRILTFLSYLVKDFNFLQVDSKTRSHGCNFSGIILMTPSDGPVGMCPAKKINTHDQHFFNYFKSSQLFKLKITAQQKEANFILVCDFEMVEPEIVRVTDFLMEITWLCDILFVTLLRNS